MFFGQQFDCSLRTDRSTRFGRSWTLICSNQVLTACGLHCLIIIFNGSWGCPLIAGEQKTVAYFSRQRVCSLAPEGGRSSLGCGHDAGVARQRSVQPVQEHVPRQHRTDRQRMQRLVCGVNASHGDSLSAQNCCY